MTHSYLQKAVEQLIPLQTQAVMSEQEEDQIASAVLFSVIVGLQLLMQNQTVEDLRAEALAVSESIFGSLGLGSFLDEIRQLTEAGAPLDTPISIPERLAQTAFFQSFLPKELH